MLCGVRGRCLGLGGRHSVLDAQPAMLRRRRGRRKTAGAPQIMRSIPWNNFAHDTAAKAISKRRAWIREFELNGNSACIDLHLGMGL